MKEERCSRKFDRLLCCFDPLSITPFDNTKNAFRKVQRFWQRKVWTQRHSRREKLRCNFFGKEKRKTPRQYQGAHFWQGEVQNSSPILARQWWRHFRLSLSLSLYLSLSLSHRMYLTHNIGSASALPIIYRKRFRASFYIMWWGKAREIEQVLRKRSVGLIRCYMQETFLSCFTSLSHRKSTVTGESNFAYTKMHLV